MSCPTSLGIVGVAAFAVAQRTREIGIRLVLGAKGPQIVISLLRQFSLPLMIGLALGIGGAVAALLPARRALRIDPWRALRHE